MLYDNIAFCHEFRDYQQRVLDSLEVKLDDNRIHVVAAPGSGKTVLGLEIIRRIGKKAVVFAPSISIRAQWQERFLDLFVRPEERTIWEANISSDLDKPGIITCVTYQALYAKYDGDGATTIDNQDSYFAKADFKKLATQLKGCVVCLDEAHHLKREWWKALEKFCGLVDNTTIIALTATPPYDAADGEWAKYNALCGEIDCEIFTPEMVQKNSLCPYQDHVYITMPTDEEKQLALVDIRREQASIKELLTSKEIYEVVRNSGVLISPEKYADCFMAEPRLIDALLSYLKTYGMETASFYESRGVIGKWDKKLTEAAYNQDVKPLEGLLLEAFLSQAVAWDESGKIEELLIKNHFLSKGKLNMRAKQQKLEKMMKNSATKMNAIKDITKLEAGALGDRLRMLILVDNIRKEDLSKIQTDEELTDIGCVSVFEMLRRREHNGNIDHFMKSDMNYIAALGGTNMAMLCGSFCILPANVCRGVSQDGSEDKAALTGKPLGTTDYVLIDVTDTSRKDITGIVTELLGEGKIKILVGTVALLGEGWDAPAVNTVILGSTVSSFVQSNQMRGRGLRLDNNNQDKCSNIWHLCTLVPDSESDKYIAGDEYKSLVKRFDTMLGISMDGTGISNGMGRLNLDGTKEYFTKAEIEDYQGIAISYAADRAYIRNQWITLMREKTDFSLVRNVAIIKQRQRFKWYSGFSRGEIIKAAMGLLADIKTRRLVSDQVKLAVNDGDGKTGVFLTNCKAREGRLFSQYLGQLLGDIVTHRYILERRILLGKKYMALPEYCHNQKDADDLIKSMGFMGSRLIYTRTDEGRKLLFSIRMKTMKASHRTIQNLQEIVMERVK